MPARFQGLVSTDGQSSPGLGFSARPGTDPAEDRRLRRDLPRTSLSIDGDGLPVSRVDVTYSLTLNPFVANVTSKYQLCFPPSLVRRCGASQLRRPGQTG